MTRRDHQSAAAAHQAPGQVPPEVSGPDGSVSEGAVPVPTMVLGAEGWETTESAVPREEPVTVFVNGSELVTLLASPGDRLALVAGFLYDEGIIDRIEQVRSLEEEEDGVRVEARDVSLGVRLFERRVLGSGCGKAFAFASALDAFAAAGRALPETQPWVAASVLTAAAAATYTGGGLYRRTRGTHAAALVERGGRMVGLAEDIGRHNAVDRVVGRRLLAGEGLQDLFMVVTGRISSEMVGKIAKTPIPLIVSKSVPTELALDYADRISLAVVGRVSGGRMRVYTYPQLIDPGA